MSRWSADAETFGAFRQLTRAARAFGIVFEATKCFAVSRSQPRNQRNTEAAASLEREKVVNYVHACKENTVLSGIA